MSTTVKAPKQNPVDKYPQPPYPEQEQEMPGSEQKMDPKPDHGESSYRGSGKLTGRKALITGGDSAAIQNFTSTLAQLWAEKDIRVNGVAPGPI